MRQRRSAAQVLVWLTLGLPMFMSLVGLAIDGGLLLTSHRELQSVADGAARAGATRLDAARLRDSGGADVELDPGLATEAARTYIRLALSGVTLDWQSPPDARIDIGVRRIRIDIHARLKTAFLRIVHIDSVSIETSSFADVQYGIRDGGGG
jgi:hypothetical protein